MNARPPSQPTEKPRSEPEIIPPGAPVSDGLYAWRDAEAHSTQRIYVARLGPWTTAALVLGLLLLAVILFILLIGTVLLWLPLVLMLIAGALVSTWWRRVFRR